MSRPKAGRGVLPRSDPYFLQTANDTATSRPIFTSPSTASIYALLVSPGAAGECFSRGRCLATRPSRSQVAAPRLIRNLLWNRTVPVRTDGAVGCERWSSGRSQSWIGASYVRDQRRRCGKTSRSSHTTAANRSMKTKRLISSTKKPKTRRGSIRIARRTPASCMPHFERARCSSFPTRHIAHARHEAYSLRARNRAYRQEAAPWAPSPITRYTRHRSTL